MRDIPSKECPDLLRLPVELFGDIAKHLSNPLDIARLCRVNHSFNTVFTPILYGHDIKLLDLQPLRQFCDSILVHRPDLGVMVRSLEVTWTDTREDSASTEDIERVNQILAASINLQRLIIQGGDDFEPGEEFYKIFRPLFILPNLRHLQINCTIDEGVLQFVQHHYRQLHSLCIIQDPCYGYDVAETRALTASLSSRFSLPLQCSSIKCSPSMAPIFIPGSSITTVSLLWPGCELERVEDVDSVASTMVKVLMESAEPVQSIYYRTLHWNFAFIQLVPIHLPQLRSLTIKVADLCWIAHGDIYNATEVTAGYWVLQEWFDENIASFKSLEVLRLRCRASVESFEFDIYEDFGLVRKWISLCPTLVHCYLPSSLFPWVRLPGHDFCVPDTEYKDSSPGWRSQDKYDPSWTAYLFEKKGLEFAAIWKQRCDEIRKSQCSWIGMEGEEDNYSVYT